MNVATSISQKKVQMITWSVMFSTTTLKGVAMEEKEVKYIRCPICGGTGKMGRYGRYRCITCKGRGVIPEDHIKVKL
jgi:DnaJ-class molecular chaperone